MRLLLAIALAADLVQLAPADLRWGPSPPSVPPGAKAAVLEGDPKAAGTFTMRMELPPGYRVPQHTHAADERVTVLAGSVTVTLERGASKTFPAGSFYLTPTPVKHTVSTDSGATIQITGMGPWSIEYVDPKDDPRKK
ncbi:MAG: cupin domain-containing protein [Myxococcota bacterium]